MPGKNMKPKLDDDGHVVTKQVGDVLMVVYTDGKKEETYDPPSMQTKIKEQAEDIADLEKSSAEDGKKLEKELRSWKRLGDLKEVRAAVQTVKSLKDEDLDAAELPAKLSEVTAERDALQEQITEKEASLGKASSQIYELSVGNEIANAISELDLIEGMTPRDVRKLWGDRFKLEDGRVFAYNDEGKPVMIVEGDKPRTATVKEALDQFIPPAFRKPSGAKGSDATNVGGGSGVSTVRTKADLKTAKDKSDFIDEHGLDAFQKLPLGASGAAS